MSILVTAISIGIENLRKTEAARNIEAAKDLGPLASTGSTRYVIAPPL
jgi:hypothetical protein